MHLPTPFSKVGKIGSCHKQKLYSDFLYSISLRDLIHCLRLGLGSQTWQVSRLTILVPMSRSHELTTDFSKPFWSCRVRFQVRYQLDSQLNPKKTLRGRVWLHSFSLATATRCCLLSQDGTNKTSKLQNLNPKIDCDVYCYSLKWYSDFQYP